MIKLKDILLEMGSMTIKPILDLYDQNPERVSSALFPGKKTKSKAEVENELKGFDYNEFSQFRDELGVEIEEAEKTPEGRPLNKAYLTKNKTAMKRDIDKAAKLSDNDPSAYGKWSADYSDKAKTKRYPTRKSASTTAYEKRFGKSEIEEINFKKVLGTAALAAGLAGSPNMAKAQEPNKAPTTQVQQQDTAKTATATYTHPNENTARNVATTKARAALATKLGKSEGSISTSIVDIKMYQLADGKYECTSTVKIN